MTDFVVVSCCLEYLEHRLNQQSDDYEVQSHVIDDNIHVVVLARVSTEEDFDFDLGTRCDRTMQNLNGLPQCILEEGHDGDCSFK